MTKGLIPGYRFVEEFSEEFQHDYEEEVSLVTLDLGQADPSIIPNANSYRLIGLDTPTPFLQLGGNIFKGHYETLLGSEILFKDGSEDPEGGKKIIVPQGITSEQRVRFNHLILKTREEMEEEAREKGRGGSFPIIQETFSGAKSANGESGEGMSVPPWERGVRRGRARGSRARGRGKGTGRGKGKGKGKERAQESEKTGEGNGEGESDWMDLNEGPEDVAR